MRKQKLFHDFDRLSPADLQRVHDSLANSTYAKTMAFLRDEFGIHITYNRLQRYYQRWQETLVIQRQTGVTISINEYIQLQNGEALPFSQLTHYLIQKAACIQAAHAENLTIAKLLTLQRIASHEFNQRIAREKLELEQRKQAFREKLHAHRVCRNAQKAKPASDIAPAPHIPSPVPSAALATPAPAPSTAPNVIAAPFAPVAPTLKFPNPVESFTAVTNYRAEPSLARKVCHA